MSNNLIKMTKIRSILRLYTQGVSKKTISEKAGATRNTVKKYIRHYIAMNIPLEELDQMSDTELEQLFSIKEQNEPQKRMNDLLDIFPEIEKALKRKGVTKESVWRKYFEAHPDGYRETQFRNHYNQWSKHVNSSMHVEHKAGDKMFVDYAGHHLKIVNDTTGEIKEVEVFAAILGASQLTYVEATYTQQKEDFITSCENAVHYFGGAPQAIVTDNLKSAVIRSSKYEPTLNEAFSDFILHYCMAALPAGPYKPKHKALVEGVVKIIYRTIFAVLNDRVFTSLEELNIAIWEALEEHNNRPMSNRPYSRRQLFEEVERLELQSLPLRRYDLKRKKVATVMKNNYVCLAEDKNYYSVPYIHIGKKVNIFYSQTEVEVFYRYERIAHHLRDRTPFRYITVDEHMAYKNRFMTDWTPEYFIERATNVGDDTRKYIISILEKRQHPEQAYRSCQGILSFASKVGNDRLDKACHRALLYRDYSYMTIKTILERKMDQIPLDSEEGGKIMPLHGNIRGKLYYK
jgi:transposase